MQIVRWIAALIAVALALTGLWQLESDRAGLVIEHRTLESTPYTIYRKPQVASAPVVVIAHGFAGSRQLMEAYALTMAQAGYIAVSFDFFGHGRNTTAMSGDVTSVEGTTQQLVEQTGRVVDEALSLPQADGRAALIGHSMASDIVVRYSLRDDRVNATVAISMFSEAVTANAPENLLMITGAWEASLREEAVRVLRLADPEAEEGDTVGDPAEGNARRAVVAPAVEHVGVLFSATALREARAWLDKVFGRSSAGPVAATGGWIVMLLAGIVLLFWPLTRLLPEKPAYPVRLETRRFYAAALIPAVVAPLALALIDTRFLPVLVADYLAAHLLLYGLLSLALLWRFGISIGRVSWFAAAFFTLYSVLIFGGALDRYAAAFFPPEGRILLILAIAAGAVPYIISESYLTEGGRAPFHRVLIARGAFLGSLVLAVALDFERLFFLVIIFPVIVIFYAIFGMMAGWVGRRTGSPVAAGLGLGLILAWALGVTFPLFSAG